MNSATNKRSSPSAQHPIKFTNLLCRTFPTPQASVYTINNNNTNKLPNYLIFLIKKKKKQKYHKLVRVRPGELGEALNGDDAIVTKLSSVNHIRSFLSTLRYYQFAAESIRRSSQLRQRELFEYRYVVVLLRFLLSSICFIYSKKKSNKKKKKKQKQ